ncbi:PDZ domain-containing protein [Microbulbifer sp. ANSA003]|uniref:PDZ domain-containing protein n=1 Tax=Microbulbifer sp. ANSA003 TaxID=3243360 RepID=UPI004041D1EC
MISSPTKWEYKKETQKVTGDIDNSNASIIVNVAKNSPADSIGLKKGDFILSFNGEPLIAQDEIDLTYGRGTVNYRFYSRGDHTILNVKASPVPLGVITEPSSNYILKELKTGSFPGWEGFRLLWKRRDWERLLEASEATYSDTSISRIIRKAFKNFGKNAGMLYKGASLFETNREKEGIHLISDFIDNQLSSYETFEHAIAYFYASKWCELRGDKEGIEHWLLASDRSNAGEFERISQETYLKGFDPAPKRYKWINKEFPSSYIFENIGSGGTTSLTESLARLDASQLLPVCVMPFYRGNGPYNDALGCYGSMFEYISDKIAPMHVIMDSPKKEEGEEWRYENEEKLINNGVPFELLYDPESSISKSLDLEYSPVFYLLNQEGFIVYEGALRKAYDYWDTLVAHAEINVTNGEPSV